MSAVARNQVFSGVHTVGGLLPSDMLIRISEGKDVAGSVPADYGVVGARSVRDEAERHWDYLKAVWSELRQQLPPAPEAEVPADPTGLAVSQWLVPLFVELGFGALTELTGSGISSDDASKTFPISHRWNHVPIHFTAWQVSLDKRPGGAGTVPAQSLVQECLNRSDSNLWAVVTNGRQLRLLRDSSALATASYVEFDLEAIFDGELFSEFVLLYRLLHVSRFAVAEDAAPSTCWLEKWRLDAITSGTRALDQLRDGVQAAITTLGTGFLRHPDNTGLRVNLDVHALHGALLRLVYRMLFVFVAEDRKVLHDPRAEEQARDRYAVYFSTARLRAHARRRRGTTHDDLYRALRIVLDALADERGFPELGLPGLGGIFDVTEADAPLQDLSLPNEYLLTAVRHLAQVRDPGSRRWRSVDYQHLGAEELGSIYESLLELVPKHSAVDRSFELVALAGNARKTTGSYYTPSSLIECLLNSALDPVINDAVKRGEQAATAAGQTDPADAIVAELLSLKVCDPACGSGHFLVAAARRIAKRVASVRERNPEPTLDAVRSALHDVIARCIYGVDLNPMAVELAKVSLWLEALEPGKPLSFLDAHVKCGNALIGTTPALLAGGIPDEAFKPIEGDDPKFARSLEKRNRSERLGQGELFGVSTEAKVSNTAFATGIRQLMDTSPGTLAEVRWQEAAYRKLAGSGEYQHALHLADAWCAAFLWPKTADAPLAITENVFRTLQDSETDAAPQRTHDEIVRMRDQYRFFHWHLEFPDVFSVPDDGTGVSADTGWAGGFDSVLGNPPWDQVQVDAREFFAATRADIAEAANMASRNRMIKKLAAEDPDLFAEFAAEQRKNDGFKQFVHASGRFPLTSYGRLNTYSLFAEHVRTATASHGRCGQIVPSGIATDSFNQYFFKDLVQRGSLGALYDFENRGGLFPAVDSRMKFCILSLVGRAVREPVARFAFFLHDPAELDDADKAFALTAEEIMLLNPNTGTCPVFRSRRDAEITLDIYRRVPVLIKEPDERGHGGSNPWGLKFQLMFMSNVDSDKFGTIRDLEPTGWRLDQNIFVNDSKRFLPLHEAKLFHHYDHRWATYREDGKVRSMTSFEKADPNSFIMPRYWLPEYDTPTGKYDKNGKQVQDPGVATRLSAKGWNHGWLLAWRDICRATDERTMICSIIPRSATPEGALLMLPRIGHPGCLTACLSSLALDFVARQKVGGTHLRFYTVYQLPVLSPTKLSPYEHFISSRVLELAYTSYDMEPFARDIGDVDPPFQWDDERRAVIRAELDALFFHLYGISRGEVHYILDTFPIVKRKDEARYGTYRTKDLILSEYDRIAAASLTLDNPLIDGKNYTSTLTPPPGQGPRHPAADKEH